MARTTKGATAPTIPDIIIRRERPSVPLAWVRAGTPRGEAWLLAATTAADDSPVSPLGWPIERPDVRPLARAALAAGLTMGEERPAPEPTVGGVQ